MLLSIPPASIYIIAVDDAAPYVRSTGARSWRMPVVILLTETCAITDVAPCSEASPADIVAFTSAIDGDVALGTALDVAARPIATTLSHLRLTGMADIRELYQLEQAAQRCRPSRPRQLSVYGRHHAPAQRRFAPLTFCRARCRWRAISCTLTK